MPDKALPSDSARLNEEAARRLIQRATELDASLAAESSVAELREAARGAGISDEAFQRALEEVRAEASVARAPVKQTGTFAPRRFLIPSVIALIVGAMLALVVARRVSPTAQRRVIRIAPDAPAAAPTPTPTATPTPATGPTSATKAPRSRPPATPR